MEHQQQSVALRCEVFGTPFVPWGFGYSRLWSAAYTCKASNSSLNERKTPSWRQWRSEDEEEALRQVQTRARGPREVERHPRVAPEAVPQPDERFWLSCGVLQSLSTSLTLLSTT